MSIRMMFRKCEHCGYKYTYNPSVGNLGIFCPKCKRGQSNLIGKCGCSASRTKPIKEQWANIH